MAISKNGNQILSIEDWEKHAPPKSPCQWKDEGSAKEFARAWIEAGPNEMPKEIRNLIEKDSRFGIMTCWEAEPEAKLKFDDFKGETSNSDMAIHVKSPSNDYLIAIEAKADETFSETVCKTYDEAYKRKIKNPNSKGVERIHQLANALFGLESNQIGKIAYLRYQLFTASAGALCEAGCNNYSKALLIVHEFYTDDTEDENHKRNSDDLNEFIRRLSNNEFSEIKGGEILGPIKVPGNPLIKKPPELFIGKVSRNIRT